MSPAESGCPVRVAGLGSSLKQPLEVALCKARLKWRENLIKCEKVTRSLMSCGPSIYACKSRLRTKGAAWPKTCSKIQ
jgi:hypothetical protein